MDENGPFTLFTHDFPKQIVLSRGWLVCRLLWGLIEPLVLLRPFLPMLPPFSMTPFSQCCRGSSKVRNHEAGVVSLPITQHNDFVPGTKPVGAASNVPAPTPDDWQEARVQGGKPWNMEGDSGWKNTIGRLHRHYHRNPCKPVQYFWESKESALPKRTCRNSSVQPFWLWMKGCANLWFCDVTWLCFCLRQQLMTEKPSVFGYGPCVKNPAGKWMFIQKKLGPIGFNHFLEYYRDNYQPEAFALIPTTLWPQFSQLQEGTWHCIWQVLLVEQKDQRGHGRKWASHAAV